MTTVLKHRVDDKVANSILNITYSITIGLFFKRLFFTSTTTLGGSVETEIAFLLSPENWLAIVLILLYFIIDWFSTNVTIIEEGANHIILFLSVIFIFYYGFICSQSIFPSEILFLHFGIYNIMVCGHDFLIPLNTEGIDGKDKLTYTIQKIFIFICRLALSGWLVAASFAYLNESTPMLTSEKKDMFLVVGILVLVKLIRYFYYVYLNEKKLIRYGA